MRRNIKQMSESIKKLKGEKLLIQIRRNEILDLLAQGKNQNQIAQKFGVSPATISLDLQYLSCKSEDHLRNHIQSTLPLIYDKAMSAFTQVKSKTWDVAENAHDERTKLQAYSQFMECWKYVMEMSASSPRITSALKYVSDLESKKLEQEQQEQQEREQSPTEEEQELEQENGSEGR
jgi:predicted transcriptional regulator